LWDLPSKNSTKEGKTGFYIELKPNYTLVFYLGGLLMDITDIRIRRIETIGKLKAVVSVTFDDMFAIHDMKIIEGQNGYFIAMPSRRTSNGEYKDIAHPINSEARALIQNAILEKFESLPDDEGYASFQM
jgi:stage V sporulation protein G